MIAVRRAFLLALVCATSLLPAQSSFPLAGLTSPATVAETIFIYASAVPAKSTVTYLLDGQPCATSTQSPFWLGGTSGFSLRSVAPGTHTLQATAKLASGQTISSGALTLSVIPSLNAQLSTTLTPYANQPSAQTQAVAQLLAQTSTAGALLSPAELSTRRLALAMYKNWGIDPSLDTAHDQSDLLLSLNPKGWAPAPAYSATTPLSLLLSPDAPFYQAIPALWPRVALPTGYIQKLQLNTNQQGDGIGFGEVVASPGDSSMPFRTEWYTQVSTLRTFAFSMPATWPGALPSQPAGDRHMVFVSPQQGTFVSSYMTSLDPATGGPDSLYAAGPTPLNTLGDHGGSAAAWFAELPILIQPGETTNPTQKIRHALGGSVARVWAARVYPASAWDSGVKLSVNTCTGLGFTNTGLVPYGGIIQLDPKLDLTRLTLTLPARRILEAFQTYGYYVMDFGCTDLDIYTAIPESELDPYGGLWGYNRNGPGVQNEVQNVLTKNPLYLVAPLTKKQ